MLRYTLLSFVTRADAGAGEFAEARRQQFRRIDEYVALHRASAVGAPTSVRLILFSRFSSSKLLVAVFNAAGNKDQERLRSHLDLVRRCELQTRFLQLVGDEVARRADAQSAYVRTVRRTFADSVIADSFFAAEQRLFDTLTGVGVMPSGREEFSALNRGALDRVAADVLLMCLTETPLRIRNLFGAIPVY